MVVGYSMQSRGASLAFLRTAGEVISKEYTSDYLFIFYYLIFFLFTVIMMLLFKDSKIGKEPALFICKEKDDEDAKTTTLIICPPIIGRFSERWGRNSYPFNLPKWS